MLVSTVGSKEGVMTLSDIDGKSRTIFVGTIVGLFDGLQDGCAVGFKVGMQEGSFVGFGKLLGVEVGVRVLLARAFVITYTAPTLFKAYGADTSKSRYVSLL
jgi:hypothetical protein